MKPYFILIGMLLLASCVDNKITDTNDYDSYLTASNIESIEKTQTEIDFWSSRIKEDSIQLISLAKSGGAYSMLFDQTNDIEQLKNAERVLKRSADIANIEKDGYLLSLAQNYISQHRFQEAQKAIEQARELAPNKDTVKYLSFDIAMELGQYEKAEQFLRSFKDVSDFNYLIRLAKFKDYKGELGETIHNMEEAKRIAEAGKNKDRLIWTYTNLADYYGHDGSIEDSYIHYVRSLELDPNNAYAKKGIAWIAYSHENNPEEALRILNSIPETAYSPDYYLFKAEIADSQNDSAKKEENLKEYWKAVDKRAYGGMYNAYNAVLLAEEKKDYDTALQLAMTDVRERPTPETYSTLAYVHHLKGDAERALELIEEHVANKTFEPVAHLYMAQIYKANDRMEKVAPIKEELMEADYELGPVTMRTVKAL